MSAVIDLVGRRYERLTVIARAGTDSGGHSTWTCLCDCGKYTTVSSSHLNSGSVKSCGCYGRDWSSRRLLKHGFSHTRIFNIWKNMIARCEQPERADFCWYGGRGICVCEEWKNDFLNFKKWALQNGYADQLTLDRVDNNKNYSPDNCRWANISMQARNRRNNHILIYKNQAKTIAEWSEITGIHRATLTSRVKAHWSIEKTLTLPVKGG